jgi:hypothetical protein
MLHEIVQHPRCIVVLLVLWLGRLALQGFVLLLPAMHCGRFAMMRLDWHSQ